MDGWDARYHGYPHVVVVGGGFGGLYAAQALENEPVRVTLVDRRNFHLFQPLLYQVATGVLSPADIAQPLRSIFKKAGNVRVLLAEVEDFDTEKREVVVSEGGRLRYDHLIVAAGSRNFYFGHDEWTPHAHGLKTVEEATKIRQEILLAFEAAERESDPEVREALMTFVVVGGGPTGVELAGALAEISRYTLRDNFRSVDPADAKVIIVEGGERLLAPFAPELSRKAQASLESRGVRVRCKCIVESVDSEQVKIKTPTGTEVVKTRTVLWGAGVAASPLAKLLADRTGAELDRAGRINVDDRLHPAGRADVFAVGDMARCLDSDGKQLPGVAPVAMQQGRYAARAVLEAIAGREVQAFRYEDRGSMATIGRSLAVAQIKGLKLSGFPAWLVWLFVHLMYLVTFENRVLVFIRWAWNYVTWNRGARLITGEFDWPGTKR